MFVMVQSDPESSGIIRTSRASAVVCRGVRNFAPSSSLPFFSPNSPGHLLFNSDWEQPQPPAPQSTGWYCFISFLAYLDALGSISCSLRSDSWSDSTKFPPILPEEWEDCWRGRAETCTFEWTKGEKEKELPPEWRRTLRAFLTSLQRLQVI